MQRRVILYANCIRILHDLGSPKSVFDGCERVRYAAGFSMIIFSVGKERWHVYLVTQPSDRKYGARISQVIHQRWHTMRNDQSPYDHPISFFATIRVAQTCLKMSELFSTELRAIFKTTGLSCYRSTNNHWTLTIRDKWTGLYRC